MRLGLPLMVLTSLSLHVIALLFWLLSERPPPGSGGDKAPEPPGPAVIISREIEPPPPRPPPSQEAPPPPRPPTLASKNRPPPSPLSAAQLDPETILAGRGGPHLTGGIVFLLDVSGSMYEPYAGVTRLALARKFIDRQIDALPNGTPFAIALYGETTRRSGPLVAASETTRAAARQYLAEDHDCGGGTNLPAGLDVAEDLRPSSIILVTDGDLNIADSTLLQEARRILGQPGPQLSVFGIAPRASTDDEQLLEDLVRQQAGTYQAMGVPGAK